MARDRPVAPTSVLRFQLAAYDAPLEHFMDGLRLSATIDGIG
jgi:hypothetical protein